MHFYICYVLSHIPLILAAGDLRYVYYENIWPGISNDIDIQLLTNPTKSLNRIKRNVTARYQEGSSNVTIITQDTITSSAVPHLGHDDMHLSPSGPGHPDQHHDNESVIIQQFVPSVAVTPQTRVTVHTLSIPPEGAVVPAVAVNQSMVPHTVSSVPRDDDLQDIFQSFPFEFNNITLKEHNISKTEKDSHTYYNSSKFYDPDVGKHYWVDLNNNPGTVTSLLLSHSYRRASTVPLPFKFPFYGHEVDNITIATGGFIYTGDYVHSWLAATQYIAPLMANFDTSISNNSHIKYAANATSFTVLWENVSLQDKPNSGDFTFEVTLHSNGDIIFVYKNVPNVTGDIQDENHPVKVGLSDAYILDRTIFFVRRKTIFEYHRVHFDKRTLRNWTVIYLKPQPTCITKKTCESCLAGDTVFNCQWCDNRCSTGIDRLRNDWMKKDCDKKKINDTKHCSIFNIKIPTAGAHKSVIHTVEPEHSITSASTVFLTLITIGFVISAIIWTLYAYRNPHSTSGQILIKYRPSQWSSWRKGEARYTAATIHM